MSNPHPEAVFQALEQCGMTVVHLVMALLTEA